MLSFSLLFFFFKIKFFLQINHQGILSDGQTVGIQIKLDILLVFKLFAKLPADDKILCSHAKSYKTAKCIISFR